VTASIRTRTVLVEASRRRTLSMRRPRSLARAKGAISGEGAPQLFGVVREDSEEPERSFVRSSGSRIGLPQTPGDPTVSARMEPAFKGVAVLLARARSRRYVAEQDRAEDDTLPLDKTNLGLASSPAVGTQKLLTDESQFYSGTSEAPRSAGSGSATEKEPSPRETMAPRRAA